MFITIRTVRTITPALKKKHFRHLRSIHSLWMYARTRARLAIRIATAAAKNPVKIVSSSTDAATSGRFAVRRLRRSASTRLLKIWSTMDQPTEYSTATYPSTSPTRNA